MSNNQTPEQVPINDELEKKREEFHEQLAHKKPFKRDSKVPKKKLAFGFVLLAFLLVSLASAAVYALWFSPERAVTDAIVRALGSQTVNFSGTYQAGNAIDATFSGAAAGANGAKLTLNARLDFNNRSDTFSSDIILDRDGNVYMSAGGIQNALGSDLVKDAAQEGTYANLLLQKIEGKWLKITSAELQPYNKKYASIQSCLETVIKKVPTDQPVFEETVEIYQKDRFIVVDKVLGNHGTSTGYLVHVEKEKLKSFLEEFKTTVLYRQLHDCDSATFDLNPTKIVNMINDHTSKVELWINQAHEITEIYTEGNQDGLKGELRIAPRFNQEAKIIVPTSTVSLEKIHEYLADGTQAMALTGKTDVTSKLLLQALKAKLSAQ
jgi:hypothetical protein